MKWMRETKGEDVIQRSQGKISLWKSYHNYTVMYCMAPNKPFLQAGCGEAQLGLSSQIRECTAILVSILAWHYSRVFCLLLLSDSSRKNNFSDCSRTQTSPKTSQSTFYFDIHRLPSVYSIYIRWRLKMQPRRIIFCRKDVGLSVVSIISKSKSVTKIIND